MRHSQHRVAFEKQEISVVVLNWETKNLLTKLDGLEKGEFQALITTPEFLETNHRLNGIIARGIFRAMLANGYVVIDEAHIAALGETKHAGFCLSYGFLFVHFLFGFGVHFW